MNIEAIQQLVISEYNTWKNKLSVSSNREQTFKDRLHAFRTIFEPHIYNLLNLRYGLKLDTFWKTYFPPKKADRAFVIVERRCHPNFWFVLRNIAWACPDMSVYIFCSDINIHFIRGVLGNKVENFNIIQAFNGHASDYAHAIDEYNDFLTNYKMYENIDADWILLVQMDVFIRRKIPDSIFVGHYWGYPFGWRPEYAGGGGATIRNVKSMRDICKKYRPNPEPQRGIIEDVWFCEKMIEIGADVPPFEFRRDHIMENVPALNPYIVHQFWTYIDFFATILETDTFRKYWDFILTFEID